VDWVLMMVFDGVRLGFGDYLWVGSRRMDLTIVWQ